MLWEGSVLPGLKERGEIALKSNIYRQKKKKKRKERKIFIFDGLKKCFGINVS